MSRPVSSVPSRCGQPGGSQRSPMFEARTTGTSKIAPIEAVVFNIGANVRFPIAETTSRLWVAEDLDHDPDILARQVADLAWAGLRGIHRIDG